MYDVSTENTRSFSHEVGKSDVATRDHSDTPTLSSESDLSEGNYGSQMIVGWRIDDG